MAFPLFPAPIVPRVEHPTKAHASVNGVIPYSVALGLVGNFRDQATINVDFSTIQPATVLWNCDSRRNVGRMGERSMARISAFPS